MKYTGALWDSPAKALNLHTRAAVHQQPLTVVRSRIPYNRNFIPDRSLECISFTSCKLKPHKVNSESHYPDCLLQMKSLPQLKEITYRSREGGEA